MVKGLYTAYTGMINEQNRMDVLTNNLANFNTTGYKKEGSVASAFSDKLALRIKDEADAKIVDGLGIVNLGVKTRVVLRIRIFPLTWQYRERDSLISSTPIMPGIQP